MPLLTLSLKRVQNVLGIYGDSKNEFPKSMALLHPEAAEGFAALQRWLGMRVRVSDMFRTAEQSLQARVEKAGVQPPGYSLHNYGLAIDIDTDAMLKTLLVSKPRLDTVFSQVGWWCHRKDGARGSEDWHYNWLGPDAPKHLAGSARSTNTSAAGDSKIRSIYGTGLTLEPKEMQEALAAMRMYGGEIDGAIGPRTREALKVFQRAWKLPDTGEMDPKTERTLAYVSAKVVISET